MTTKPRVRIGGHGTRLRARLRGDWERDPVAALQESCRAATAIDKATAEAIGRVRQRGVSWADIARTLGVAEDAADKQALIDAMADGRRLVLEHQLRDAV